MTIRPYFTAFDVVVDRILMELAEFTAFFPS